MFNLSIDNEEEALKLIKKVYLPSNDYNEVLAQLNSQVYKRDKTNNNGSSDKNTYWN